MGRKRSHKSTTPSGDSPKRTTRSSARLTQQIGSCHQQTQNATVTAANRTTPINFGASTSSMIPFLFLRSIIRHEIYATYIIFIIPIGGLAVHGTSVTANSAAVHNAESSSLSTPLRKHRFKLNS